MGARLSRTPGPILSGDPYQLKFLHRSYEVHSFLSSEDALQSLRAGFTPSALVVDLALPEMDGFVFLETLLKEGLAPGAPRLILTNQTKPAIKERAHKLGVSRIMTRVKVIAMQGEFYDVE